MASNGTSSGGEATLSGNIAEGHRHTDPTYRGAPTIVKRDR